jgi:hypothetical protein
MVSLYFLEDEALWTKCICALSFIKNITLLNNIEFAEEIINSEKYGSIWTLFKLFLSAFFLCHIVGTMYFFVGLIEMRYSKE